MGVRVAGGISQREEGPEFGPTLFSHLHAGDRGAGDGEGVGGMLSGVLCGPVCQKRPRLPPPPPTPTTLLLPTSTD